MNVSRVFSASTKSPVTSLWFNLTSIRHNRTCLYKIHFTSSSSQYHASVQTVADTKRRDELTKALDSAVSTEDFQHIISSWVQLNEPEQAQKAFERLQQKNKDYIPSFDMTTSILDSWIASLHFHYSKVQEDYTSSRQRMDDPKNTLKNTLTHMIYAAENAESILKNIQTWSSPIIAETPPQPLFNRGKTLCPTSHHFDAVIHAWGTIVKAYKNSISPDPSLIKDYPTRLMYRTFIHGIPQRATLLLETMERLALSEGVGVTPTVNTYNTILDIWACSSEHNRRVMAQSIFHRMSGSWSDSRQTVLDKVMATRKTYQIMIQLWCRLDTASQHIPSSYAFHGTHHLLQMISLLEKEWDDFEPTLEDYNLVLKAWSHTLGSKKSSHRALSILRKMEALYSKGQTKVRPDIDSYKHVLKTLAKTDPMYMIDAGERVDQLFANMNDRNLLPDNDSFTYAIETWSRMAVYNSVKLPEKTMECIQRAENYLRQMSDTYHRSSAVVVRPRTLNYNAILRSLAEIKLPMAIKRAENLLYKMEILGKEGNFHVQPNTQSYTSVIECWRYSSDSQPVDEAIRLLDRVTVAYNRGNIDCRPTTALYNATLSVCLNDRIHPNEHEKTLRIAFDLVQKMKSIPNCEPDPVTYSVLLQIVGRRIPLGPDRSKALESIFKSSCLEGLVDRHVVESIHKLAPEELYRKLMLPSKSIGDPLVSTPGNTKTLPSEWTMNVKGKNVTLVDGRKIPVPLTVDGKVLSHRSPLFNERKMKRLRNKTNQKLLRGGRILSD